MMKGWKSFWVASALVGALSCTGDNATGDTGEETVQEYLKQKWGIRVTGFTEHWDTLETEDGTIIATGSGKISVDGLGESELSTETIISPMALGGDTTLFVSNTDGSDSRYFLYNTVQNYITFGDLEQGVAVSKNPDGTYDLWTFAGESQDNIVTVSDGYEALQVVEQYNGFKDISPYILLMAFAVAQTPATLESRLAIDCDDTAAEPAVCDIFREFCDCAACLVLDRDGACDPCPKL